MLATIRQRIGNALTALGRRRISRGRISGHGIEIGALHAPFRLPSSATALYVDRAPVDELRHHYPELADSPFTRVDIVDDAETLATLADATQDFVIALHVLEHCEDPIGALSNWIRVLKRGGVALIAVPDKRRTYDAPRRDTTNDHLIRDHLEGPAVSREAHYREWVELVERAAAETLERRARELQETGYRIHFHVWDDSSFRIFLNHCVSEGEIPARVERFLRNRAENLALLARI